MHLRSWSKDRYLNMAQKTIDKKSLWQEDERVHVCSEGGEGEQYVKFRCSRDGAVRCPIPGDNESE